jgi:hypothetical protein
MKKYYCFSFLYVALCWAVPKPMEAIPNYNVMMVHGAYGSDKGIQNCSSETPEAVKESKKADFRPPLL